VARDRRALNEAGAARGTLGVAFDTFPSLLVAPAVFILAYRDQTYSKGPRMSMSFAAWRAAQRRQFVAELEHLRRSNNAAGKLWRGRVRWWWRSWWLRRSILALAGLSCLLLALASWKPWPLFVTLKHLVAARNCDAARSVGLAPARRGEPGYWAKNDADSDGIACEPWPRRR
jgi:hypothetical protein